MPTTAPCRDASIAPWDRPEFGIHPLDLWLSRQDLDAWSYVCPGHLRGPDYASEDEFERLDDYDAWSEKVRADLKVRCRLPRR